MVGYHIRIALERRFAERVDYFLPPKLVNCGRKRNTLGLGDAQVCAMNSRRETHSIIQRNFPDIIIKADAYACGVNYYS
jgi:hypothetical protein